MNFTGLSLGLLSAAAATFVNAFIIWLVIDKMFRFTTLATKGFRKALETAVTAIVISFSVSLLFVFSPGIQIIAGVGVLLSMLIINTVVLLFLIKEYYELAWGEAVISWLTVSILSSVSNLLLNGLLGTITFIL